MRFVLPSKGLAECSDGARYTCVYYIQYVYILLKSIFPKGPVCSLAGKVSGREGSEKKINPASIKLEAFMFG